VQNGGGDKLQRQRGWGEKAECTRQTFSARILVRVEVVEVVELLVVVVVVL
jgi:hypothetical protein